MHNVAHQPGLLFGSRVASLPPLPSACLSRPRPRPLSASLPAPSALIEVGLPRLNLGPAFLRLRKALSKPRMVVRPDARFLTYFGKLNREQGIALLNNMMARWPSNMQVCVEVAKKYHKELGSEELVKVF